MANAKISQLPAVTSINGVDLAVVVQGGTTSQTSVDDMFKNRTMVAPVLGTPASGTLTNCTGLPVSTGVAGLGTGVATALAVNVGSAGAPVVLNGALGTPSSGTLTNATGLPVATGISGLGAGVATFLATPSSANLATAVTGETGSGALVFGTGPTISAPVLTLKSYTYAQLVALTPAAGDVARVTAANAGLTWGDPIAEGSADTAYQVWYNGAAWTVTGK